MISITNNQQKRVTLLNTKVLYAFGTLIALLLGSYVYLINQTVFQTAHRQNLGKEIQALRSRVGNLELRYISLGSSVNLTLADKIGLREVTPTYLIRKGVKNLSLNSF